MLGRDLLLVLLLGGLLFFTLRGLRRPFPLGPPEPARPCPIAVEVAGVGVRCFERSEARQLDLRSGDRIVPGGPKLRERMAPGRLAVWQVPIDLNRASLEELTSLDGIGPALGRRILAKRPFATTEELRRVRGIGPRLWERVRAQICVGEAATKERRAGQGGC